MVILDIASQPVTIDDTGVQTFTDATRKAIIRPDTGAILGVFRTGYKVHDYDQWLINNVEGILDDDLHIGSAGLLRGEAVAWVQVEMADTLNTAGVEFRPFLTATTSLDGSIASRDAGWSPRARHSGRMNPSLVI